MIEKNFPKRQVSEPVMILERFDRKTLARMEMALEQACGVVATGNQKHRSRRYIAKRIIDCASSGARDLGSLTAAAIAAAEELNARRINSGLAAATSAQENRLPTGLRA